MMGGFFVPEDWTWATPFLFPSIADVCGGWRESEEEEEEDEESEGDGGGSGDTR